MVDINGKLIDEKSGYVYPFSKTGTITLGGKPVEFRIALCVEADGIKVVVEFDELDQWKRVEYNLNPLIRDSCQQVMSALLKEQEKIV